MNNGSEERKRTRTEFFAQVQGCPDCGELKAEQAEVDYCDQRITALEKQRNALKVAVIRTSEQRDIAKCDLDDCLKQLTLDHGEIETLDNQLDNCTGAWEHLITQRDALKVQRDALKAAVLEMHNKSRRRSFKYAKIDLEVVRKRWASWPQLSDLINELEQTRAALADADERAEMQDNRLAAIRLRLAVTQRRFEEWQLQYLDKVEAIVDILASHDRV